jgi:hypothetical protein
MRDPCPHQRAFQVADADCQSHTVNWRERAKATEAALTALRERLAVAELRLTRVAERATAMARAGVGTVEPWAQAGKVIRETGYELLALVGPLPTTSEVQAVQDVPPDPATLVAALHGAVHEEEGPENRGRLQLRSLKPGGAGERP